jgi:hypothetical protein
VRRFTSSASQAFNFWGGLGAILSIVVAVASLCRAEPAAPPITDETLNGTWEAVVAETDVIRMEIRPHGPSYLVESGPSDEDFAVYRLTQRQIHDGNVLLRFEKISGGWQPKELTLRGYGYISNPGEEAADLRVKLINSLGSYDLHLMKGTITKRLAKLSKRAGELIARQKR